MNCTPIGSLYTVEASARGIRHRFLLSSYLPCEFELVLKSKQNYS